MKHVKKNKRVKVVSFISIILLCLTSFILVANYHKKKDILAETYINKLNLQNTSQYNITSSNNQENIEDSEWKLILVNNWNPIPEDYNVKLKTVNNNYKVDERIYFELLEMFECARNDGVYPIIRSAYRTNKQQEELYTKKVLAYITEGNSEKDSKKLAKDWVAAPGTSEHQIGLAVDINAEKDKCTDNDVYDWLNENSYKYGFIMRYPAEKKHLTGINYEPWHYRYVGKEAAKEMYEQGMCLEEYIDSMNK